MEYTIKVVRKVNNTESNYLVHSLLSVKNTEHLLNAMYTFAIGSLVFSKKCRKNLPKKLLLENVQLWRIRMQAHHK